MKSDRAYRIRVWDAAVRISHWLLVALIPFSWWSAEEGRLEWHRWAGYSVLTIVLFRVAWGFWGSENARFGNFLRGFSAVGAYAGALFKKTPARPLGHNPLGGWSVLLMISLLLTQTILGLYAVDVDGIESGPLAVFISFDHGRLAAQAHGIVFNLLLALISLHLFAVLFYAVVKRDNLVGPMITGAKTFSTPQMREPRRAQPWRAILILACAAAFTFAASKAFWAF
jgi:cytochrome b